MTEMTQPRYRRRVPCRMHVGQQNYAGVVLNLSGTGLFVQTSASASPGETIELTLGGSIPVSGEVVWRRKVAPMLRSVAEGGVGVLIHNAPEAYYALLASAAIPGIFPRVEIDGAWYFDGGITANVPVRQALRLGAESVIVLNVSGRIASSDVILSCHCLSKNT